MRAHAPKTLWIAAAFALLCGCASTRSSQSYEAQYALAEAALQRDIAVLASEDFGGRRPASPGEVKTLKFLQKKMENAGYISGTNDPAHPWRAPVSLVTSVALSGEVTLHIGTGDVTFSDQEAAALTGASQALVEDGELVMVGKATDGVAAEDVRGKVAILQGEPGKSPARRAALFEQGAAAVITLVESSGSIDSLKRFAGRERFRLESTVDNNLSAYVTQAAMDRAVVDFAEYAAELESLQREDARAVLPLPLTARIKASSDRREAASHNFIAKLPGTRGDAGAVLLLAHWDHFGECGELGDEDRICNGAADNASGVAAMIEIARRLAVSGPHDRDIYVLGTTAEEWGLLGAESFVKGPPLPLDQIVAAFNFDTVALAPRGSAVGYIGEGQSGLDAVVLSAIEASGRDLGSRVLSEQFLQRQDGWALLKNEVPAVMISSAFGDEDALNTYLSTRYHKASDEAEGLELGGAVEDLLMHEALITQIASVAEFPESR